MKVDLFDFELPPERIALRPVRPRDAARMLVVRPESAGGGAFEDRGGMGRTGLTVLEFAPTGLRSPLR